MGNVKKSLSMDTIFIRKNMVNVEFNKGGTVIRIPNSEWEAFIKGVKNGEFDI